MGRRNSLKRGREKTGEHSSSLPEIRDVGKRGGRWYLLLGVVVIVVLMSYLNSFNNQFVFDDIHLIESNLSIRGIEKIPRIINLEKWRTSYRPVRMVSYALDYTLNQKLWRTAGGYRGGDAGLNPFGFHLSNCVYHLVVSVLVFMVVYRLALSYRVAFLAAALFALHPVHTDSVTYISGRRDIFFTLFYLLGFYWFLKYRETGRKRFIGGIVGAYVLSLGSKEMGVTLPGLFFCYDVLIQWSGKGSEHGKRVRGLWMSVRTVVVRWWYLYLPIVAGALAYSYYKIAVASVSGQKGYYGDSVLTTFLTVGKILVHYLKLLFYPVTLNADYSYNAFPLSQSLFEPATLLSFVVLGMVGYGVVWLRGRSVMGTFGVIWFFVTLLPVCHIFPHHELLAEHYLYLPSVGICLVAAVGVDWWLEGGRYVKVTSVLLVIVALLFSLRIIDRNRDWRDALTLWEKTVSTVPQCARAHVNLGSIYIEKKRFDEVIETSKRALAVQPLYADAYKNLGIARSNKGMLEEAIAMYKKALDINYRSADTHANLGNVYFKQARFEDAVAAFETSLSFKRTSAKVYFNLGVTYDRMGRLDEAKEMLRKALNINRYYPEVYLNLGNVYMKQGKLEEAIAEYQRALAVSPNYPEARVNLGNVYMKQDMLEEAIAEFQRALAVAPDLVQAHYNLGIAYQSKKDFGEAVLAYTRALSLRPDHADAHLRLAYTHYLRGEYDLALTHCDKSLHFGGKVPPQLLEMLKSHRR